MFIHSEDEVAIKIESGSDMSLEANDRIYLMSYIMLALNKSFGYGSPPSDAVDG